MSVSFEFELELWHLIVGGIIGYLLMGLISCWIQSKTRWQVTNEYGDDNVPYGVTFLVWPVAMFVMALWICTVGLDSALNRLFKK